MKVFLSWTSFLPSYGGPAYSVSRLAAALAESGAIVGLWAADGSAVTTKLLPPQSSVQRLDGSETSALDRFGRPDILHDNGIWMPHNHALAQFALRHGVSRVVSLRGMIEPWAINYKKLKKKIAWWCYQHRDLKQAQCHHATSETEAGNAQRYGLGVPICVIPNGVDLPERAGRSAAGQNENEDRGRLKTALFLGRIHPIKGLPMLIEAWLRVRPQHWRLTIAGPDELGHRAQLEELVLARNLSDNITFSGPMNDAEKQAAFFNSDILILSSHSENFGMVVAEALAHGLPVLTTTGTPWSMVQAQGCGWWVDASVAGIAAGLAEAASCDSETLRQMGARGREWVRREFGWGSIAKKFLSTYKQVLSRGQSAI